MEATSRPFQLDLEGVLPTLVTWNALPTPSPIPPKKQRNKTKNKKKTCELKCYLCFLEPIKSLGLGDVGNFHLAKQNVRLVKLIKHKKHPDVSDVLNMF